MRSEYMATTQTRNTMAKLGYMGLIPFLFGLLLSLTDSQFLGLSGETLFITYSVVILSFLSGILWGNGIENFESQSSNKALILSNVIVLAAWVAVLLGEQKEFHHYLDSYHRLYCCLAGGKVDERRKPKRRPGWLL